MALAIGEAAPPPKMSAVEIQQEYYEAIGGVDWELYEKRDRKYLLQKIAVALYGPPTKEGNLAMATEGGNSGPSKTVSDTKNKLSSEDELELQGYELRDEEGALKVFNKICEQAKYSHNGENILISILRVVCVVPKKEVSWYEATPQDYWVDLHNKSGDIVFTWPFHVFCIRQCISMKQRGKACKLYIDHDARVYKDWQSYLDDNKLPKSVMVVPENGEYTGTYDSDFTGDLANVMPMVKLSVIPSPALGVGARVLSVTDNLSAVANIGALVGIVGALAVPAVAPVALGAALGVGVVTGTYGIVRASVSLADRSKHEQSIGVLDSEARNCWINIMVSTVGLSASASGQLLKWAAASGTNVRILMNAVKVLQFANLTTGAIGVANGFGDMIYKFQKYNETPSTLEVFQLTSSLLFFGIGAMSNQTAQEIVQDAQANKINEVRDSLSNNFKKKMFDKMTAETRRLEGTIKGNSDIISGLKRIDNKDEFFGRLAKMNKQLNKNKVRISLSSDGNPLINNQHNIAVAKLQTLGKGGRDQLLLKYGPARLISKNVPTRVYASETSANATAFQKTCCVIRPEEMIKIGNFLLKLSKIDQECVAQLLSDLSADIHDAFLLICAELIASFTPVDIMFLQDKDPNYKIRLVLSVFDYLKSKINVSYSDDNISFGNVLKRYVKDGRIPKETILRLKQKLFDRMSGQKLHDDPRIFDGLHRNTKNDGRTYLTLQAGEIFKIGIHDVQIKIQTIDKLEEWFKIFFLTQVQCDMFLNLCFEVISSLSKDEISDLNEINPDDDAIMPVACFLMFEVEILDFLADMTTDIMSDMALNLKHELLKWRYRHTLRSRDTCKLCQGLRYKD